MSFQEFVVESIPSNTEKLFFSIGEFSKIKWIEEAKEFEFNDKLYDVSSIEQVEKGFYVYCVNDSFEESFVAMFDQWKKSNSSGNKIKSIFHPQFCNRLAFDGIEPPEDFQIDFHFDPETYVSPISPTPSPPPKFHSLIF